MARVSVTVSPGAARTELVGRHGDGWRARVAGRGGRAKVVEVDGLDAVDLDRRLARAVSS